MFPSFPPAFPSSLRLSFPPYPPFLPALWGAWCFSPLPGDIGRPGSICQVNPKYLFPLTVGSCGAPTRDYTLDKNIMMYAVGRIETHFSGREYPMNRIRLAIARIIAPIPAPRVHTIDLEIPAVTHVLRLGAARAREENATKAFIRELDEILAQDE